MSKAGLLHFPSGDVELAGQLARPQRADSSGSLPGVVLCHGFPAARGVAQVANSYGILAERIAHELGWAALAFNFRGCGDSKGDFSLEGWIDDIRAAVELMAAQERIGGIWIAGSSIGGALALCAVAEDERVRGVATLAAPASFVDWASNPRRLLAQCIDLGVITTPGYPEHFDEWARQLRRHNPLDAARDLAPRPLLVLHGTDDELIPPLDARALADSHGAAELRLFQGGGHRLRHDPRAVAVLLGWLARQETRSRA